MFVLKTFLCANQFIENVRNSAGNTTHCEWFDIFLVHCDWKQTILHKWDDQFIYGNIKILSDEEIKMVFRFF